MIIGADIEVFLDGSCDDYCFDVEGLAGIDKKLFIRAINRAKHAETSLQRAMVVADSSRGDIPQSIQETIKRRQIELDAANKEIMDFFTFSTVTESPDKIVLKIAPKKNKFMQDLRDDADLF